MDDEPSLESGDVRWMTQFHELQKQQVTALIQQNENQKTQLEILAMQLEIEKQRQLNLHSVNDQVEAKQEANTGIAIQRLHPLPGQDTELPMEGIQAQDFELGGLNSEAQHNFGPRYTAFTIGTPQQDHNRQYQDYSAQNYHQQNHQLNGNVALPRITDLDSPDNRLLMALGGYDLPPLSLPGPSLPGPSTPANNRFPNNREHSAYLNLQYPLVGPDSILRASNLQLSKTPGSPLETPPKGKRPRLVGPALPGYNPAALANVSSGTSCHRGHQSQALETYVAGVGKLAFSLTRKDLEDCIMELALREEDMSNAIHQNPAFDVGLARGLVKSSLMNIMSRNNRRVELSEKYILPISIGLGRNGELGSFAKFPLEILLHIISFLPLGTVLTLILTVCKSLRALMSESSLWGRVVIEPKIPIFNSNGFLRFLRALPETSVRYFTFDTASCEPSILNEVVDVMLKKKHFGMVSLHLLGKKLSHAMVLNTLKRLWSENLTVFSLTDVTTSKLDSEIVIKAFMPLMPNLRRLRLEGGIWKTKELKFLSCIHGQLRNADSNKLIGDNRLTHLSFMGKNTAICWDDLKNFGKWFPELEELFISCIYADEPSWVEKYTIGAVPATEVGGGLAGIEYANKKYRQLNSGDISWHAMTRLKYFGCDHIGDGSKKKNVKAFEDIHASHIWSLIKGSNYTLERLEISRGEEYFKYERGSKSGSKVYAPLPHLIPISLRTMLPVDFPKLTYLYLAHWKIPWRWFVGVVPVSPVANSSSSSSPAASDTSFVDDRGDINVIANREQPNLRLNSCRTFVFWKCDGLPTDMADANDVLEKKWAAELREVWGEELEALDDSAGSEVLKRNRGGGVW